MEFERPMMIRALRLSLTCILLFLLTWYYQVPESAWCLITIWFVMYEYSTVGGVLRKSFYRFTGTFLSATYGIVIIYFCQNNIVVNVLALTPAVFLYSYFFMDGERTYIAVIGSVTLTIVLLNYNRVDLAILRTFNILLGVVGSLFMIRFFYPQYARDELVKAHANFIDLLSQIIAAYLDTSLSLATIKERAHQLEHTLIRAFAVFQRLTHEAVVEPSVSPLYITFNNEAFEHINNIFHLISVLINYLTTEKIRSAPQIITKTRLVLSSLQCLHNKLKNDNAAAELNVLLETRHNKNTAFVERIFDNIYEEIRLLDISISNIVLVIKK